MMERARTMRLSVMAGASSSCGIAAMPAAMSSSMALLNGAGARLPVARSSAWRIDAVTGNDLGTGSDA